MILQALTRYYDILASDPQSGIAPAGYCSASISFALNLSAQGDLMDVLPLFSREQRGNKMVDIPRRMIVPEQVKRTQGICANFLCDNVAYVLGISDKTNDDPEFGTNRFKAFRKLNKELLADADCDAARAMIAFLDSYDPTTGREHPAIAKHLEALLKGGNLVFMLHGNYIQEDAVISRVWDASKVGNEPVWGQCLVTGEYAPIARLHANIKGVRDANLSGVSLVGFNARAYESYNRVRDQGLNSPVSEKAAFAYTTTLNFLLSSANYNRNFMIGDTTVVYWAESENKEYANAFARLFEPEIVEEEFPANPDEPKIGGKSKEKMDEKIRYTQMLDVPRLTAGLDGSTRFYVLGLAPNVARTSVRFFFNEPFEKIVQHVLQHYHDMEISIEYKGQPKYITVRHILTETTSKKLADPKASPLMAGAVLRAILTNSPYPAALYNILINRIHSDMDDKKKGIYKINYVRAAIIKAILIRKYRGQTQQPYQEVLTMSLNKQSTIPAYVLGRLFAVLEKVQKETIHPEWTIKDRYFTTACATPASVFPILMRLSQPLISKSLIGYASENRIAEILNLLDVEKNPIPAHFSLDEQGIFVMGYYHQRTALHTPENAQIGVKKSHPHSAHTQKQIAL
ncbi:MAG: type I-C CRISPR-associated protein Cas8c/Csd1 [Chloroflexota bacterium]|jgi:CRISPR-associated protein Csd1